MSGTTLHNLLFTGNVTNHGEGGYLQRYLAEEKGGNWQINGQLLDDKQQYVVVMPEFMAKGGEANLGFLKDLNREGQDHFQMNGQTVKNDIRDIVIAYLAGGGK
jgi:hypothetical protein